jgi:uncharacterized protein YndB with AHSA1/START domain
VEQPVRGHYVVIDPPRRLVFTWGFVGSPELPPGASSVEVTLTKQASGTRVDLVHRGLAEPERVRHARGWRHFLGRLADRNGRG